MAEQIRDVVQRIIDYPFVKTELADDALTHASLPHETVGASRHENRRLAHLGDGVIDLYVRRALYQRFPLATKGELTIAKSKIVSNEALAKLPQAVELAKVLRRGGSLRSAPPNERARAEVFEAVLGAVFLDGSLTAASDVLSRCLLLPERIDG
jgi:ribonuclease-3